MSFQRLLTDTITFKRPATTTGVKIVFTTIASNVPCLIQPIDDVAQVQTGQAFSKAARCYLLNNSGVQEGDQAVDENGTVWSVRGSRVRKYGNFPHTELLLSDDKRR